MSSSSQKRCRTCLHSSKDATEFINLDVEDPVKQLSTKKKLEICVPEIVVEDSKSCYLCVTCWNALNTSYHFKCTCLATEEKLRAKDKRKNSSSLNSLSVSDFNPCVMPSILEIDKVVDNSFVNEDSRVDLFRAVDFFLATQKLAKCYFSSRVDPFVETFITDKFKSVSKREESTKDVVRSAKVKTETHKCKKCSKTFVTLVKLRRHFVMCKRFYFFCKKCGKGFFFKKLLLKHTRECVRVKMITRNSKPQLPKKFQNSIVTSPAKARNSKIQVVEDKGNKKGSNKRESISKERDKSKQKSEETPTATKNKEIRKDTNAKKHNTKEPTKAKSNEKANTLVMKKKTNINPKLINKLMTKKIQKKPIKMVAKLPNKIVKRLGCPVKCPLCSSILHSNYKLQLHIKRHKNEKDFLCRFCPRKFYENWELKKHLARCHPSDAESQGMDNRDTETPPDSSGQQSNEDSFFNLIWDDKMLIRNRNLISKAIEKVIMGPPNSNVESPEEKEACICATCSAVFPSIELLNEHSREHEQTACYELCEAVYLPMEVQPEPQEAKWESFKPKESFLDVTPIVKDEPQLCDEFVIEEDVKNVKDLSAREATKDANIRGNFKRPRAKSTRAQQPPRKRRRPLSSARPQKKFPFYCDICKMYINSQDHFNKHSGARPYKCDVCGVTFRHRSNWRRHENKHAVTFNAKVKCKFCQNEFSGNALHTHSCTTALGETVYTCQICKNKFVGKAGFVEHMAVHVEGEPSCNVKVA